MPPPKAPTRKVARPTEHVAAKAAELAISPDEPLITNTMVGRDLVRGNQNPFFHDPSCCLTPSSAWDLGGHTSALFVLIC